MSNMPASNTLEGRLAFDPEINVDQESGRKSVRITVIQNKGYSKETEHIVSFSCYFGGYEAERLIKAKAKKGSVVTIVGNFDSREYMRQNPANQSDPNDQIHDRSLEVYVWSWWFTPQNKPKEEPNPANGSAPANPGGYANNGQYAAPAQANTMPAQNQYGSAGTYQQSMPNGGYSSSNSYPTNGQAAGDGFQSIPQEQLPFNN